MKKAALGIIVLMAIPLAALWAQSDPAYAPPADPAALQANPADPAPASPSSDLGATDPDAVNDPDADAGTLPATSSHGPLILLMGILAIGMFLVLMVFRRRSVDVS